MGGEDLELLSHALPDQRRGLRSKKRAVAVKSRLVVSLPVLLVYLSLLSRKHHLLEHREAELTVLFCLANVVILHLPHPVRPDELALLSAQGLHQKKSFVFCEESSQELARDAQLILENVSHAFGDERSL